MDIHNNYYYVTKYGKYISGSVVLITLALRVRLNNSCKKLFDNTKGLKIDH